MNIFTKSKIKIAVIIFIVLSELTFYTVSFAATEVLSPLTTQLMIAKNITLNFKNATISQVLKKIQQQSKIDFVVNEEFQKAFSSVTINVKDVSVDQALKIILQGSEYDYKIVNEVITFIKRVSQDNNKSTPKNKINIKGRILNEDNDAVTGAVVMITGTSFGAISDGNGDFIITVNQGQQIEVSFTGFKSYYKTINSAESNMIIRLVPDLLSINDVVVTGYQQIDRRMLTSSVISVKGSDLMEGSYSSLDKMLQGKLAGVAVLNQSSTPGAAPKIRIRGSSSITGNREPMWVVDGVILDEPVKISTEELNSLDKVNFIGNAISFLNPEDIDRVDILKDASATAIYGVKAANGVIVVSTKKGVKGDARVNYSTSMSVMAPPTYKSMFRMNSAQRVELSQEMHEKGFEFGANNPANVGYEGAVLDMWNKDISYEEFLLIVEGLKTINTDWQSELFRPSFSHQHTVSVSGGSDMVNYYFSGGYSNDKSVTRNENIARYNAMAKINIKFNSKVNLGFKLNGTLMQTERPHNSIDQYAYAYETSRVIDADEYYAKENGYNGVYLPFNMKNEIKHTGNNADNSNVGLNINFDWQILSWLKFNSLVGVSRNNNEQKFWADEESYYISRMRQTPYGQSLPDISLSGNADFANRYCSLPFGGELKNSVTRNTSYTIRNGFALGHAFGRHDLSANLGMEIRSTMYNGLSTIEYGYLPTRGHKFVPIQTNIWTKYAEMVQSNPNVITDTKNNILSYYATAAYGYDGRYILNFNVRADGSNKFGQDKSVRFLPVWSVSGRWNLMNEKFMSNINNKIISDFSIRGSYGIQGNVHPDQTPDLIVKMGQLDPMSQQYMSMLYKMANTKLKWEKTYASNIAIDFSLLNNRLYGSFDYYNKKGVDQIIQKLVAPSMGEQRVAINAGDVRNQGWDLSVTAVPVNTQNWTWSLSVNTGKNYNKVLRVGDPTVTWQNYLDGSLIRNGQPISVFYSYSFGGLDENGYPTYLNANEKNEEGEMMVQSQQEAFDRALIFSGQREPDLTGGISTYIKYKRFTFNTLFSFSLGNKMRLNNLYESSGQKLPHPSQNMSSEFADRWRKTGDNTVVPALSQSDGKWGGKNQKYPIAENVWDMYNNSDIRVVSGDFMRCRSMSLRYDFNPNLLKEMRIKGASISLEAGNIFVIKDSKLKGRDPEQVSLGSRSLPPQRTFSMTLNFSF